MRIGVVPVLAGSLGGVYQYSLTMLRALAEASGTGGEDRFVVFAGDMDHPILPALRRSGWTLKPARPFSPTRFTKDVVLLTLGKERVRTLKRRLGRPVEDAGHPPAPDAIQPQADMRRWFRWLGLKLILYPAPITLAFEAETPYIMAVHDLQHRLQPHFPEVSADGAWEWREYLFRNGCRYATLLLADSEVGKEDILTFYGPYGVTPDRVKILPFLPATYLAGDVRDDERTRVRRTYGLPERYLFYPAQFWPHKNHRRLVQALGLLKEGHGVLPSIVFAGSNTGEIRDRTFHDVLSLAHHLGVQDQIRHLGYVPDADMSGLYAESVGLVLPTFFGPTNIPVLEAWAFNCPVLTSDIRGIREQVGDAALVVDPSSIESIAHGISRLWMDEALRRRLILCGRQRLAAYTPEDYRRRLFDILDEAKLRLRSEAPRCRVSLTTAVTEEPPRGIR